MNDVEAMQVVNGIGHLTSRCFGPPFGEEFAPLQPIVKITTCVMFQRKAYHQTMLVNMQQAADIWVFCLRVDVALRPCARDSGNILKVLFIMFIV